MAISLYQRSEFEAAASHCRRALKLRPAHLAAQTVLGASMLGLGQHAKAAQIFADLTRREPANIGHWMNLGTSLKAQGRYEEALKAYARAGALGEASANFYYNVGLAHYAAGNFEAAWRVLKDAVRLAPDDAEICYQYAVCCDETMRQEEGISLLIGWPRMQGLNAGLLAKIGLLLMKLGELKSAERAIELASRDPSPDPEAMLCMIQVQERTNKLKEARAALEVLKADPRAQVLGSDVKLAEARLADREGQSQEACDLYAELLEGTRDFHLKHYYLFPRATALDRLGRYDEAFAALDEAHRSQVSYLKLTKPDVEPRKDGPPLKIADFGCVAADVAAWDATGAPSLEESPVFIVGFPRSGTTLLEQTLDAHPSLESMDETRFLHEIIDRMVDDDVGYPESLAGMATAKMEELRQLYWSRVRTRVNLEPGQRLVDKNPLNLLALPAICRLFPNARIVLAIRHPCDVILSCYMQHFRAPEFSLLCRTLPSLAAGYRRAFDFWYRESAILKPTAYELFYETSVNGFEREMRTIAEFLDLPWTDAMLAPAEHAQRKGFISSPSYSQVVQPVNTRSIGRWRAYEKHFGEVLPQVRPYLDRWGYET
jgi:tetratricopeptide (TPR) repeat protein